MNDNEEMFWPYWADAFAALVVWVHGALAIYLLTAFVLWDLNCRDWSTPARVVLVVLLAGWTYLLIEAANAPDVTDEE